MTIDTTRAAIALALLAASCASGPPHGGHRRGGPPGGFAGRESAERPSIVVRPGALLLIDLDADHDMRVSKAELTSGVAAMFARADANHDGFLSPLEYDALAQAHMGTSDSTPGRYSFDTDGDNQISQAEFAVGMTKLFDTFDADHDGFVTRAEMVQRLDTPSAAPAGEQPGSGAGGPGGRGGRRGPRGP